MRHWEQALVGPNVTLREAMTAIDRASYQLALVVDDERRLLGSLSDGDARRALLSGMSLDDNVRGAMHLDPIVARAGDDRADVLALMRQRNLHQIPVLDERGVVVGLDHVDDFLVARPRDNWVVIMAGGLGSRLQELTRDVPKPMLQVGSRPLLETILRGYMAQGFRRFYFAVNYKAEQIETHFGDGSRFGAQIRYLREEQRLGTAGALSLLPDPPEHPIVVTNADLLTKEDIGHMVDQHVAQGAEATMAVRHYEIQVPFGVVREADGCIQAIEEKPVQRFVVSAGIYVLSPAVLGYVPTSTFFDMPSLFEALTREHRSARCHYINGYWLDIGRMPDYERANLDYAEVFK